MIVQPVGGYVSAERGIIPNDVAGAILSGR